MNRVITRPVWAEINLDNLKYNLKQIINQIPANTAVLAVVKADAYGHGVIPIARTLVESGANMLAVALPEEGVELRENGFSLPIQVLGEIFPEQIPLIIDFDLTPTVCKKETLLGLNQLAYQKGIVAKIHIKVDTGMNRIGITPDQEGLSFVEEALRMSNIELEGLMTHFAKADESDKEYTHQQWDKFNYMIETLSRKGINIPFKHAANSATIIDHPSFSLDLVRPGVILYGMRPSAEVDQGFLLKPVLAWKARIIFLKEVDSGTSISYGGIFTTKGRSKIATIPLGYADGFSRLLSNKGYVLIKGQKAPIRGRVCMDQFMVEVTGIPDVKVGDEVILIGQQGSEEITADMMADLIGTINYEITCNISKRVPRIYLE